MPSSSLRRHAHFKNEVLSGLTVALALVPEAVAFALLAGLSPMTGLYAAFVMGLVTAVAGGRPGMISGATGAMAVVIFGLVQEHGTAYLFPAVILCGVIQAAIGILGWGKLIRLVPHPVMLGFVNGLAIVIFMSQVPAFRSVGDDGVSVWLQGSQLWAMVGLVALTMLISGLLPRFTKAVPSSLGAILVVTLLAVFVLPHFGLHAPNVHDLAGSLKGGFPPFALPTVPWAWETLAIIAPYSFILAGVGLIESLMTLNLIDEITDTRGRSNRECLGQGAGNVLSGLFSGMGGCAMIGQSLINVKSGGRGRTSGVVAALCLLSFVVFASPLIEQIPMAALVGVMFMVVIGTFQWASLRMWRRIPTSDFIIILAVTAITVFAHNLALAVLIGVVIAALVFAWQHAVHLKAITSIDTAGVKVYQLHGPLFFASTASFNDLFHPSTDPNEVAIDFYFSRVYDQSGLEAINTLADRYSRIGKRLHLRHLSQDCRDLLDRANLFVEVDQSTDPHYHVSVDGFPADSGRKRALKLTQAASMAGEAHAPPPDQHRGQSSPV